MIEESKEVKGDVPLAPQETESTPALTESNKKRVMLGSIIGGALFLGLIIAIIILVSTAGSQYKPVPPKPKPVIVVGNPFIIFDQHEQTHRTYQVILVNKRKEMENKTNSTSFPQTKPPNIKNTTENFEPVYVTVSFQQVDEHLLNVKYKDTEFERWEVPMEERMPDPYEATSKSITHTPFGLWVSETGSLFEWLFYGKKADILPLITTHTCRLQFFDKYIELEARLQSDYIYGMGERVDTFHLNNDNYSLWNRDLNYEFGDDSEPGTYGSHPFFLNRLADRHDFIGVYMHNSNAMLFSFWHTMNNGTFINYKIIGGIIDMYIIHAADAEYILRKYHSLVGRPYLPPVWGMGFQQARMGYTLDEMKKVIEEYQKEKLPIDGIWADVDLNDNYKTFTVDQTRFKGVKEFVHWLHDPHEGIDMRFMVVANPGLKVEAGYKYYEEAVKQKCLIMSALHFDQPYEGRTAADKTVWLDYFQHNALLVWAEGVHDLHELTSFDGVWIYDNEPSNRCYGECKYTGEKGDQEDRYGIPNPFHNASEFDYIQFRPTLESLEANTLPLAAYQCCSDMFYKQYNTHNLFGLQSAKATHDSVAGIFEDKRFLVVSRSTAPGSGHYSSHWLGDNYSTWKSMIGSIAGILNFNLFGIPHVGASVGGFYGDVEPELLTRWYELGCFYPLMVSYGHSGGNRKEAYALTEHKEYIRNAMIERYMLLHYFYTKMFESYAWGGPVVHPLFFEFPDDDTVFTKDVVDRTFMWGKQLYVIPVLIQGQTSTRAYVPNWRWYDLRTGEMIVNYQEGKPGEYFTFPQPLGYITVLVKGGSIIPHQRMVGPGKIMNVEDLKKIPALLVVAPDHTGKATGSLVVDSEGIRPHPDPLSHTYRHYSFTYMNQIFRINKLAGFDFHEEYEFDYFWELIILDVFGQHHVSYVCMMKSDFTKHELQFIHSHEGSSLIIHDDRMAKMAMFKLETIVWGTADNHDFCAFQAVVHSAKYENEEKTLLAELYTEDPEKYQLKFDLTAKMLSNEIINLMITMNDPNYKTWVVPDVIDDEIRRTSRGNLKLAEAGFRIAPVGANFHFEYADPHDPHDFIITSKYMPFIFVRNFMQLRLIINSRHMFGLGERVHSFELTDGIYSLWNSDSHTEETGIPPGNNMYGSHPFYMIHGHDPHEFMGVLFLTSNPFDVRIRHTGMQMQVDHMFSGGIIDMFIITEGHANQVMQDYYYLIGRPVPLPFWAFGYHHSRWGYKDIAHLKDVVRMFEENGLPLDSVWMDKDYMMNSRSFTIDHVNFAGIERFVKDEITAKGRHFVALLDPGVAMDHNFEIYAYGLERGLFLMSPFTQKPVQGVTWPGYTVWFDFINPSADSYWEQLLGELYAKLPFDGLWLDMNEPSNFCDGECPDETHYNYYYFPLDFYDDLYYNPTHKPLERLTVSMESEHYGTEKQSEFNMHNLYGYYQSRITHRFFMQKLRKRPLILSSSTFPGIGRYATHWLGDNYSSWHHMEYSIAGMMSFSLFGIPFVGADICGFQGNVTVNLCSRWYQLGAFYPFMRNHNCPTCRGQEPYSDPKIASVAKKSIAVRYSLARYLYSEYMHIVHNGGLLIYPVLFEFSDDLELYKIIDTTFMFGHALRVTPVLEDRTTELVSYFPNSDWYELGTWKKILEYNRTAHHGQNVTLHCSLEAENLNVHVRAGSIFSYQDKAIESSFTTITKIHDIPLKLIVAPDHNYHAAGRMYYDKDEILDFRQREYHDYYLHLENNTMTFDVLGGNPSWRYDRPDETMSNIVIIGAKNWKDMKSAKVVDRKGGEHVLSVAYDGVKEIITLTPGSGDVEKIEDIAHVSWTF